MMRLKYLVVILLSLTLTGSVAQDVRVAGRLARDSAAIGELVPFILVATYPSNQQVVFPDSTYAFAPFEFSKKEFFPTRTLSNMSYDSAIYYLTTFEIDSIQSIRLPVFLIRAKDSLAVYSTFDSLRLNYRVSMPLDSVAVEKLPLKANTAYQQVKWLFNYPILLAVGLVLVVLAIIGWLIFGKQIRRFFALRRLRKTYANFLLRYSQAVEKLEPDATPRKAEDALVVWKKYMEELEEYPFTKSTSREILRKYSNDLLANALRSIDRTIYGGYGASRDPFLYLKSYSQELFERREAELRNG